MSASEHQSPIKTPKQLIAVGILAIVVPVVGAVMLASFVVTSNKQSGGVQSSMESEAVARRIKPVADVVIGQAGPTAAAGTKSGEEVYKAVCMACHGAGVAGAPKTGDKGAWSARLKSGMNALYTSALKGKGAMPAKGGNAALADADIKAAVDYLASQAK